MYFTVPRLRWCWCRWGCGDKVGNLLWRGRRCHHRYRVCLLLGFWFTFPCQLTHEPTLKTSVLCLDTSLYHVSGRIPLLIGVSRYWTLVLEVTRLLTTPTLVRLVDPLVLWVHPTLLDWLHRRLLHRDKHLLSVLVSYPLSGWQLLWISLG